MHALSLWWRLVWRWGPYVCVQPMLGYVGPCWAYLGPIVCFLHVGPIFLNFSNLSDLKATKNVEKQWTTWNNMKQHRIPEQEPPEEFSSWFWRTAGGQIKIIKRFGGTFGSFPQFLEQIWKWITWHNLTQNGRKSRECQMCWLSPLLSCHSYRPEVFTAKGSWKLQRPRARKAWV